MTEKNYTVAIAVVVILLILTIVMVMIFRKKDDKKDTNSNLTSTQSNLLSNTSQTQQPLAGYNNMLVSDGTGNISSIGFPLGTIVMWSPKNGITTPPPGWVICDGSTVTVDGEPFVLPDLRGRFPLGVGFTGMIANASTGYSFPTAATLYDLTSRQLKDKGGEERVTLDITEMPKHKHSIGGQIQYDNGQTSEGANIEDGSPWGQNNTGYTDLTGGNASTPDGKGVPHNNMPPFCAVYFIIKIA